MLKEKLLRIYRCGKRMARMPYLAVKDTMEGYYQDGVSVRRSGVPALVVGSAAATITMPVHKYIVPATIAGRLAKRRKNPKNVAIAGVVGGMTGICIVTYMPAVALFLYWFELMTFAAKADIYSERLRDKQFQKEAASVGIETNGRIQIGSLNGSHP